METVVDLDQVRLLFREGRKAKGISQAKLAQLIGATQAWVSLFENGEGKDPDPSFSLIVKAMNVLGMPFQVEPIPAIHAIFGEVGAVEDSGHGIDLGMKL